MTAPISFAYLRPQRTQVDTRSQGCQSSLFTVVKRRRAQIWIAVSVYVLVAIIKKRLNLDASLYTLLQIFSLPLFEKMPIQQAFAGSNYKSETAQNSNQLNLFTF